MMLKISRMKKRSKSSWVMSCAWLKKRFKCKKKPKKEEETKSKRSPYRLCKINMPEDLTLNCITRLSRKVLPVSLWGIPKLCQLRRGTAQPIVTFARFSSKLMKNFMRMIKRWQIKFGDQVNWNFISESKLNPVNFIKFNYLLFWNKIKHIH